MGPNSGGGHPVGGLPRAAGPHSPPAPLPGTWHLAVVRALTYSPPAPLVAVASSRGTGCGGMGGPAGARGGGPGQRLVVSGLRVTGAPGSHASVCPWPPLSPRPGATRVLSLCGRRGGWGGRSGSGGLGLPGGCPGPLVRSQPPVSVAWGPGPLPPGGTCAAACVGAGAAAAADSSGGSVSGWGRCAGPRVASCWPPRP